MGVNTVEYEAILDALRLLKQVRPSGLCFASLSSYVRSCTYVMWVCL